MTILSPHSKSIVLKEDLLLHRHRSLPAPSHQEETFLNIHELPTQWSASGMTWYSSYHVDSIGIPCENTGWFSEITHGVPVEYQWKLPRPGKAVTTGLPLVSHGKTPAGFPRSPMECQWSTSGNYPAQVKQLPLGCHWYPMGKHRPVFRDHPWSASGVPVEITPHRYGTYHRNSLGVPWENTGQFSESTHGFPIEYQWKLPCGSFRISTGMPMDFHWITPPPRLVDSHGNCVTRQCKITMYFYRGIQGDKGWISPSGRMEHSILLPMEFPLDRAGFFL
ncbi:uncharacterized protein LOC129807856 [Phlebotomus papatasi]|uniref:uncharacterized protein LOC129807856 n=1 Tax=Phlebotomus papatasi TaxID=29031 RepID=UPI00248407DD|nr:uncharacterized protein LOC129807856 [Phlebotomus papatasi]